MIYLKRIPRLVLWILSVMMIFLVVMTLFRVLFYFKFLPTGQVFSGSAFLMGLRFDLKFICILGVSILAICSLPFINPLRNKKIQIIWVFLLSIVFLFTLFFYAVDYFYFDYLQQRLNASILNYLNDAGISINMTLESYPVFKIFFALIVASLLSSYYFRKGISRYELTAPIPKRKFSFWYITIFLFFALGVFGKFSQFNLRWSDAFTLSNNFKANLSLNPFQSFFSSLHYKNTKPNINKVRSSYSLMADYLGVKEKDSAHLFYERNYSFPSSESNSPNVVLVICESFSMYRSSMSGNPFNTTPYFNELCKKGIFFDRCFTPSYPTARGVWATITSIPDVLGDNNRSASRSPEVVNQQLILNDFKGYDKFYFLGGDPSWANIKGVLLNNIDSLHLYSQDDFEAKKLNVWGIDDKNLFLEANKILSKQTKPFFAVIQTADNHQPFTIPPADLGLFRLKSYPIDSINKYGFGNEEELNAFRYTDFCYQQFFNAAQKEKYFPNTVFVFVGDHGIAGNATAMYPASWTEQQLSYEHVPLLFYAPELLQPKLNHSVVSQLDIMPSIASLLKIPYHNNSMGKNVFDPLFTTDHYAFIIDHEIKTIGLVSDQYYYLKSLATSKSTLVSVVDNNPVPSSVKTDSIKIEMAKFTEAYYETSRYLLYNNKRKR